MQLRMPPPQAPRSGRMEDAMSAIIARRIRITASLFIASLTAACTGEPTDPTAESAASSAATGRTMQVSGTAVHFFTTAAIHSDVTTQTGKVQRSTEIIRLEGDLDGYILYHPTSTFDFAAGTLVNTGTQLFSGTIAGSPPVILHDDQFLFTVNLATGATVGEVHLSRSSDAPHPGGWYDCDLEIVGTGLSTAGDGLADYSGTCTERGSIR